jgi:hypothetical protein
VQKVTAQVGGNTVEEEGTTHEDRKQQSSIPLHLKNYGCDKEKQRKHYRANFFSLFYSLAALLQGTFGGRKIRIPTQ